MTTEADQRFMALAIGLGSRGLGQVWPNPAVGCVIVKAGRIIGRGWTQAGGRPHAETMALMQAGAAARGATAYVSLEPCAHHGQTPPCAGALIAAGVSRVVSAATDPDSRVAGRGHAMLRAAGVAVTEAVLQDAAIGLNAGFFSRVLTGRPWVTLKLAMSLDGRIANAVGASRWITGPGARRAVHAMRARHDAVMVGIGTVLADDPDLTVRGLGVRQQPLRIVIDSGLRLPPEGRLIEKIGQSPVWLCHSAPPGKAAEALIAGGVRLIACKADADGRVDIGDALTRLGGTGLTRIFCEGGAGLAAALMAGDHVGEAVVFSAGRVFGAQGTAAIAALPGQESLPQSPEFSLIEQRNIGGDILHRWQRRR